MIGARRHTGSFAVAIGEGWCSSGGTESDKQVIRNPVIRTLTAETSRKGLLRACECRPQAEHQPPADQRCGDKEVGCADGQPGHVEQGITR
jgi:hypothetical protein